MFVSIEYIFSAIYNDLPSASYHSIVCGVTRKIDTQVCFQARAFARSVAPVFFPSHLIDLHIALRMHTCIILCAICGFGCFFLIFFFLANVRCSMHITIFVVVVVVWIIVFYSFDRIHFMHSISMCYCSFYSHTENPKKRKEKKIERDTIECIVSIIVLLLLLATNLVKQYSRIMITHAHIYISEPAPEPASHGEENQSWSE